MKGTQMYPHFPQVTGCSVFCLSDAHLSVSHCLCYLCSQGLHGTLCEKWNSDLEIRLALLLNSNSLKYLWNWDDHISPTPWLIYWEDLFSGYIYIDWHTVGLSKHEVIFYQGMLLGEIFHTTYVEKSFDFKTIWKQSHSWVYTHRKP